ncbi:poly(3-hydroxybutyrate) depolymerase [Leptospira sp. 96542]|nr:poly(3-hydroxybutyrate) depolymerase [Leptospira sp. 96542]
MNLGLFGRIVILILSLFVFSESCKAGWIREKIKNRFIKKMEEKPAPIASTDLFTRLKTPGDYVFSFSYKNELRYYKIHIPKSYNPNVPTSLLFALHGGGGDMEIQSNDELYLQITKSESLGHIVVFPNGYSPFKSGKIATWNAGNCCAHARDKNIDDVGYFRQLIFHITKQVNVDSSKIYLTGMSNGAMMSYRLACEMSEVFSGITAVAGTDNTMECNPNRPINIFHIHAMNDERVPFFGGEGKPVGKKTNGTTFESVPNTILKWVKFNQCSTVPNRILSKTGAYCDEYSQCKNGVKVKLCVTESGGHSWPGGKNPRKLTWKESPTTVINANDLMWEFFK